MANGVKKIIQCVSCATQYNVTNIPAGKKFKCRKCGNIAQVPADLPTGNAGAPAPTAPPPPAPQVAAPPPQASAPPPQAPTVLKAPPTPIVPQAPEKPKNGPVPIIPTKKPAPPAPSVPAASAPAPIQPTVGKTAGPKNGKPPLRRTALAGRPGARKITIGRKITSGRAKPIGLKKRAQLKRKGLKDKETQVEGDDNVVLTEKKKSKLPLILGIAGGVIVIAVILFFVVFKDSGSRDEDYDEDDNGNGEKHTEQPDKPEPDKPGPKKPDKPKIKDVDQWKAADAGLKKQIAGMLKEHHLAKKYEIKRKIQVKLVSSIGPKAIPAIIECFSDPDKDTAAGAKDLVEWATKLGFGKPPVGQKKPPTLLDQQRRWKIWWLNAAKGGAEFKFHDRTIEEVNDTGPAPGQPGPKTPGPQRTVRGFQVNDTIKEEVLSLLEEMKEQNRSDFKASVENLKGIGEDKVIPVLIITIGHENEELALTAEKALKKITKRPDALNIGIPFLDKRRKICEDWQRWWVKKIND